MNTQLLERTRQFVQENPEKIDLDTFFSPSTVCVVGALLTVAGCRLDRKDSWLILPNGQREVSCIDAAAELLELDDYTIMSGLCYCYASDGRTDAEEALFRLDSLLELANGRITNKELRDLFLRHEVD